MATLLMLLTSVESPKLLVSLNSESLRKSPPIDLVEKSPLPILLLNVAVLHKASSGFFNAIDIIKQSQ